MNFEICSSGGSSDYLGQVRSNIVKKINIFEINVVKIEKLLIIILVNIIIIQFD
jgi:hypothetical protein